MKLAGKTDKGGYRSENQDNYRAARLPDDTVWAVVCDGMGGAAAGQLASLPQPQRHAAGDGRHQQAQRQYVHLSLFSREFHQAPSLRKSFSMHCIPAREGLFLAILSQSRVLRNPMISDIIAEIGGCFYANGWIDALAGDAGVA